MFDRLRKATLLRWALLLAVGGGFCTGCFYERGGGGHHWHHRGW
ncbi:MAG TPA: hypothetical protein VLJ39_22930 [Tepidisphaeraceae bacterium]|jgi:hypothetical protein|nr:hypothetical protein [Tepidisphaeraceae bacterium]